MVTQPDQTFIVATADRRLLMLNQATRSVLCPQMRSKVDLWHALRLHIVEVDVMCRYVLQLLVENANPDLLEPLSVTFNGRKCSVEFKFLVGLQDGRSLVISLYPEIDLPINYQQLHESAMKYNTELSEYVHNCRNDAYYNKAIPVQAQTMTWNHRKDKHIDDFIPSMDSPELMYFVSLAYNNQGADPSTVKASMERYLAETVDPDSIPPSFSVNNTNNHGQNGALLARQATAAASSQVQSDKRCFACGTHKSPEWRRGPDGPKTLCNACGLRYAKQLRAGQS